MQIGIEEPGENNSAQLKQELILHMFETWHAPRRVGTKLCM